MLRSHNQLNSTSLFFKTCFLVKSMNRADEYCLATITLVMKIKMKSKSTVNYTVKNWRNRNKP